MIKATLALDIYKIVEMLPVLQLVHLSAPFILKEDTLIIKVKLFLKTECMTQSI